MDSKFAVIDKYEDRNVIEEWCDEEFLNVLRSIVDVTVPTSDYKNDIHPADNFKLEEWALYHTFDVITDEDKSRRGRTTEQIYEHYHGMGLGELEGLGW